MSDLTAAVEAAANTWPPHTPRHVVRQVAAQAIDRAAPIIEAAARADERAKVAAELRAEAIRCRTQYPEATDVAKALLGASLFVLGGAEHAGNGHQDAAAAPTAPPESDRTPEGTQTPSGGRDGNGR